MIFTEFIGIVKMINFNISNNEDVLKFKTIIIDWLILKYYFPKLFFMFQSFNNSFENFLIYYFKDNKYYDLINDALRFDRSFTPVSSYGNELNKLEDCIFIIDLFSYDSNVWSVENGKIIYKNKSVSDMVNSIGLIIKGVEN